MQELEGIAAADARLGRPFPLPELPLPLARWVQIRTVGEGVEVEWNLDDSRAGAPGRLALYAGHGAPPEDLPASAKRTVTPEGWTVARTPLAEAQPSLRPVVQVQWTTASGLHLRLTGQGPWSMQEILSLARSVA